jgi:hypothetical protein
MAKRVSKVRRLCNPQIVPSFRNPLSFGLRFSLLRSLLAFLPHRGSRPLHSSIFWTGFGVLVREVVERGLECNLLVPPFVHHPFAGFRTSRLDHPRSPVLMQGGLTIYGGGLTGSGAPDGDCNCLFTIGKLLHYHLTRWCQSGVIFRSWITDDCILPFWHIGLFQPNQNSRVLQV